ncbi:MAG: sulfotransferase family 2 domain-containing protein, partial [Pseudomonadota bacterium]
MAIDIKLGTPGVEVLPKTQKLFSISRYPIRYMVTPKCGCTFIKNLMWRLEHGSFYHSPMTIHDKDETFLRAADFGLTEDQVRGEDFAFMAVRKPVDRFFSLYAEKVIGQGWQRFVPLRQVLVDH